MEPVYVEDLLVYANYLLDVFILVREWIANIAIFLAPVLAFEEYAFIFIKVINRLKQSF